MKNRLILSLSIIFIILYCPILSQSSTPSISGFKIVTWNVEWFGFPEKSKHASSFKQQLDVVTDKILNLDADIYALQEVVVSKLYGNFLDSLVNELNRKSDSEKWGGIFNPCHSQFYRNENLSFPPQKTAYIYKLTTVKLMKSEAMFCDLYLDHNINSIDGYLGVANKFFASGRLPFLIKVEATINKKAQEIYFINLHLKCCRDGLSRRDVDMRFLKTELVNKYTDDNIVILGDYNGSLNEFDDLFTDNNKDFKNVSGSGIDYISISNELYDEDIYNKNSCIKCNAEISDHCPKMLILKW